MRKYCIINGDDFGFSRGINCGILEAHQQGVLTSTSVMVDYPAAGHAARLPREAPRLSVGLHVVLTHEDCTPRIDFNSPSECRREIASQWARFVELLGQPPSHLDAHHNIYRDERLTPLFLECANENKVPLREHSRVTYFPEFYGQWDGEIHLEQIGVENLCSMLETRIRPGITELGCHPGYIDPGFESSYALERETELRTLCSPMVRQAIRDLDIHLISYKDLRTVVFDDKAGSLV